MRLTSVCAIASTDPTTSVATDRAAIGGRQSQRRSCIDTTNTRNIAANAAAFVPPAQARECISPRLVEPPRGEGRRGGQGGKGRRTEDEPARVHTEAVARDNVAGGAAGRGVPLRRVQAGGRRERQRRQRREHRP